MTAAQAIKTIEAIKSDIKDMKKFKGQASILKSLRKKTNFLSTYSTEGSNIPELMVKEAQKEAYGRSV